MKILKNYLVYTMILVLLLSIPVLGAEIKDVPESHWAYDSVNLLVEKGYLSLYEDDTFKGTNKVSRYELAEIVARILKDASSGVTEMSQEDVDTLRELSIEFRDELVDLANKQSVFSNNLDQVQKKNVVQDEAIGKTYEKVTEVQKNVNEIIDKIVILSELNNKVETLTNRVSSLEENLESTNKLVAEKDDIIAELKTELQETDIKELKDKNSVLETKVNNLQSRLQTLQEEVNKNNNQLAKLTEPEAEETKSSFNASQTTLILGGIVLLALLFGS